MPRLKHQSVDKADMPLSQSSVNQAHDQFSERRFWHKVKHHGARAGRALLRNAFKLYCAALDKDTPRKARWTIYLALGYFIWPIDIVPDFLPGLGYTDDMGVLAWAVAQVALHIKPEHHDKATQWIERWWPDRHDRDAGDDQGDE